MTQELPFEPFSYIENPHYQTIFNTFFTFFRSPTSERKILTLPDGDRLSLECNTPKEWKPSDPTVLLVHGLCGSHKSPNLIRMARRLKPLGVRVVRFNMRGCGSGRGLARQIYHSGRSEDVFEALKALKAEYPDSPILLIGFSLGGNIVLKLAGELNSLGARYLKSVIAISPPIDLYSSVLMLGDPANAMYERYFYRMLRAEVHYRHRKFKDLPPIHLPKNLKLYEFDQMYTAPACGFKNARDYYQKCSAAHVLSDIRIPCKVLLAEDDPIVSSASIHQFDLSPQIGVFKTKKGGHMGYLGRSPEGKGFYWLDSMLLDWIQEGFRD